MSTHNAMRNAQCMGTTDVCRALDLAPSTVSRDVRDGRLVPSYVVPRTGAFLFTPEEVARYAEAKGRTLQLEPAA
jgi:hypothetical protein